jgi:hypothetical protein
MVSASHLLTDLINTAVGEHNLILRKITLVLVHVEWLSFQA